MVVRAGARTADLGGPSIYQGGQSLKLSTIAAVFKRVSLLIDGARPPLGAGPGGGARLQYHTSPVQRWKLGITVKLGLLNRFGDQTSQPWFSGS